MLLRLGTKAETLASLYQQLTYAEVLPQVAFTVKKWRKNKQEIWNQIVHELQCAKKGIIVRSSALNEDTGETSLAGKFESISDVQTQQEFENAVKRVISSYDSEDENNQVLVQPMLKNVKICGVAFTLEPNTLGNYYVINYDEIGSTSSVTSGTGAEIKLLYVFKDKETDRFPSELSHLGKTLAELEKLFEMDHLDVEFAITEEKKLYIFQVRPLCLTGRAVEYQKQKLQLQRIEKKIVGNQSKKPFLCGEKSIYGVMPDWNPAEMIGIRPKPLAMSLYREIITDNVWAYQRDNYGYRNLRSFPLMLDFCGLPYIDIRVSFNSFIPADLDEAISEKLVNYYMERLIEEPSKHDKVEFDIVFSCYTLDLPQRIQVLREYGFTDIEIEKILNSLRNVTNNIINHKTGLWRNDYEKIGILEKRFKEIMNSDMEQVDKVYWLLEDCKRYGTLPFAGLARAAFIAVQILQSLVTNEIISQEDYQYFMKDVNTVSSNMNADFADLSKKNFLKKYGHLRPGTYDITSKRYDEAPELYFDWDKKQESNTQEKGETFRMSLEQLHKLKSLLKDNGLNENILELMDFIKSVIEGREYGKFIFTKNLSQIIKLIGEIGEKHDLEKEECAFCNISVFKELYVSTKDVKTELLADIHRGKEKYEMTKAITMPPLILKPSDVWSFYYPDTEPNYITLKTVKGELLVLESESEIRDIKDKIILIPSADPGYDWIFSHGIKGFITKYGGANSHMAIRAGELGIPAAIGVGTKQFDRYKNAAIVEIDTLAKMIRILQ